MSFCWNFIGQLPKREFYSLEELLFIEEANSPFLDETMIPFQPREYIRIIAEE